MNLWRTEEEKTHPLAQRYCTTEDIHCDQALVKYDILGSMAHARMLMETGMLEASEWIKLHDALFDLLVGGVELTPEDEDVHTKIEVLLTERLGELGGKLHTGRSRNDQVLLDTRLLARERLVSAALSCVRLAAVLSTFARKHADTPMPGYTHSRKAMPTTVGTWAAAHAEGLIDHLRCMDSAYDLVGCNPLGAAAGYGVPIHLDSRRTAELLGFERTPASPLYSINSRGILEHQLLSTMAGTMLSVSRMADDLVLFSREELGFFRIPEGFTTGSSIMPQKRNPDVLELARARAASVVSCAVQTAMIVKGLSSGYHRDMQQTKGPLISGLDSTCLTLEVLRPLVRGLEVDQKALRKAMSPELYATAEVYALVKAGKPFRSAYRQVKTSSGASAEGEVHSGPPRVDLQPLYSSLKHSRKCWVNRRERLRRTLENLL